MRWLSDKPKPKNPQPDHKYKVVWAWFPHKTLSKPRHWVWMEPIQKHYYWSYNLHCWRFNYWELQNETYITR